MTDTLHGTKPSHQAPDPSSPPSPSLLQPAPASLDPASRRPYPLLPTRQGIEPSLPTPHHSLIQLAYNYTSHPRPLFTPASKHPPPHDPLPIPNIHSSLNPPPAYSSIQASTILYSSTYTNINSSLNPRPLSAPASNLPPLP